jgi:4-amino-4-deoxy-L-arabinose transferase-like glycosyltransferase
MLKRPYLTDLLLIFLILLSFPLSFYKLGQSSLVSWDEAWYAEIARNILKTGNPFNLVWSGEPYFDHPAAGFWLEAISFKILGISAYSARFMSALAGLLSMAFLYLLGKNLLNRTVGFVSALSLPTAYWFLYRARTGNLDIYLAMFFITSFYFAFKSLENKKFLIPLAISLALLFLTKTAVPFTIIPSLLVIFWKPKKLKLKDFLVPVVLFLLITGSWFVTQFMTHPDFIKRLTEVGLPGVGQKKDYFANFQTAKEYLHLGIGKWFWLGVASTVLVFIFRVRRLIPVALFNLAFFVPFILSDRGGIWHLIPLFPFLILIFVALFYLLLEQIIRQKLVIILIVFAVCFFFGFPQVRRSWYEFIDINPYISDEEILSTEAGKYPQPLLIEGYDFRPAAIFYSGKDVPQRLYEGSLPEMFSEKGEPFLLITYENVFPKLNIPASQYQVLKKDRDKVLVLKK